jgi:hypothetical protein
MFSRAQRVNPDDPRKATTRQYVAWLLAALVVLFCLSARLNSYNALRHNLRPTSTRAYFDSDATRLGTSLVVLLLVWWAARASTLNPIAATPSPVCATAIPRRSCGGFDLDFHVRPPPRS